MPVIDPDRRRHAAALVAVGGCLFGVAVAGTAGVDESLRSAAAGASSAAAAEPSSTRRVAQDHGPQQGLHDPDCDPRQRV